MRRKKVVDLPQAILDQIATKKDTSAKEKARNQATEDIHKNFATLKDALYGLSGSAEQDEARLIVKKMIEINFVKKIIDQFGDISLDDKKQFKDIWNCLLNKKSGGNAQVVEHLASQTNVLHHLVQGVKEDQQIAVLYLEMLKATFQYQKLVEVIIGSDSFWVLFDLAELNDFVIAASAFVVLKQIFVDHPATCDKFISGSGKNTETFIERSCHLMSVGTSSQRKKAMKMIETFLSNKESEQLALDFSASPVFAKSVGSLLKTKDLGYASLPLASLILEKGSDECKGMIKENKPEIMQNLSEDSDVAKDEKGQQNLQNFIKKL